MCSKATETVLTFPLTYPQTVVLPRYGGSSCLTPTTTCTCQSCELYPFATSTGECSAVCSAKDGSTATGLKRFDYPISVTGNLKECVTTSYKTCYSSCSCDYTSTSTLGGCTVTSTISTDLPWVGTGIQKNTALGTAVQCRKTLDLPCSTTYTPVDCARNTDCRGCSCAWLGTPYVLGTANACVHSTIQASMYGGSQCPTTTFTQTCSQTCPGCSYGLGLCSCDFVSTSTLTSGSSILRGTSKCVIPPASSHSLCSSSTIGYSNSTCISTFSTPVCAPNVVSCNNLCTGTTTNSQQVPYTLTGFKTCSFSDTRPASLKPSTCTSTVQSTIPCSETISPVDCRVEYICPTNTPSCAPASTTAKITQTIPCAVFTVQSASFGGVCNAPSVSTKIDIVTCLPTPIPSNPLQEFSIYNLIVFGYAKGIGSSIGGRVAVQLNANFTDYLIGANINKDITTCNSNPADALVVGGSANIKAQVFNGNTLVNGTCTPSTINSDCQITCKASQLCGSEFPFDFGAYYASLSLKSDALAKLVPTVATRISDLNSQHLVLTFSGKLFEVIRAPVNPNLNWWIFSNNPAVGSTVIINVPGKTVNWVGLNFDILKTVQVIFNFYEADTVSIDAMDLPGTVFALNATLYGSGTIKGSVFVRNLDSRGASLKFLNAPFTGQLTP
ncbi:hypothetical protein HMI54_000710 [Coelomomyces lativittatus]|nr:hypothetical protein HMI56_006953 [Coelomomyces lativittatus]KAJ1518453.1 hypothetical protein HMI54_000710 [Coelomomyces lativittatus]